MGDTKLEIANKTTDDPPPGSFKKLSNSDLQETPLKETTNMSKSNSTPEVDGADEKMIANEEKPLKDESNVDKSESKYSLNADKQNGEAKLDIGDLKPAFVGMGKEELMKFANDPFWIKLRWILFIAFWLIWLAMLIGAIAIIIAAPKCAQPEKRTWWERGPLALVNYDANVELLDYLKNKKVEGIIISNNEDSYEKANKSEQIVNIIKKAKALDINVIITLDPTTSEKFFHLSTTTDEYRSYYIWADSKGRDEQNALIPPNNWMSPDKENKSAWMYASGIQKYYYSPLNRPTLNFRNQRVIDQFSNVIRDWLEMGVKGFHLQHVPFMLVDEKLQNDSRGSDARIHGSYIHTEYKYYTHKNTFNVEGIGEILQQWRDVAKNITDPGPFMLEDNLVSLDAYMVNGTLTIDLPKHTDVFMREERIANATNIYNGIIAAFNILGTNWPIWQYNVRGLDTDVMNILTMVLPGSILIHSDWDIEREIDEKLYKIRDSPAFETFDNFHCQLLANDTVFAYQRAKKGYPGYLVTVNPSGEFVTADLSAMKNISQDVTIQLLSTNYTVPEYHPGAQVPIGGFKMPPTSAAILMYVPQ